MTAGNDRALNPYLASCAYKLLNKILHLLSYIHEKSTVRTIQLKFSSFQDKVFNPNTLRLSCPISKLHIVLEQKYKLRRDHGRKWLLNKTVMKGRFNDVITFPNKGLKGSRFLIYKASLTRKRATTSLGDEYSHRLFWVLQERLEGHHPLIGQSLSMHLAFSADESLTLLQTVSNLTITVSTWDNNPCLHWAL